MVVDGGGGGGGGRAVDTFTSLLKIGFLTNCLLFRSTKVVVTANRLPVWRVLNNS